MKICKKSNHMFSPKIKYNAESCVNQACVVVELTLYRNNTDTIMRWKTNTWKHTVQLRRCIDRKRTRLGKLICVLFKRRHVACASRLCDLPCVFGEGLSLREPHLMAAKPLVVKPFTTNKVNHIYSILMLDFRFNNDRSEPFRTSQSLDRVTDCKLL